MQFFKVKACINNLGYDPENASNTQVRKFTHNIFTKTCEFNHDLKNKDHYCVCNIEAPEIELCAVVEDYRTFDKDFSRFVAKLKLELTDVNTEEVTFMNLQRLLDEASRNGYIEDDDEVLGNLGLDRLNRRWRSMEFGENLIEVMSKEHINDLCYKYLSTETMLPEVERIYQSSGRTKTLGHPVHYLVETDDRDIRRELYRGLLSVLYESERIKNRRYCFVDVAAGSDFSKSMYEALYKTCCGGAFVVRFMPSSSDDEKEFASDDRRLLRIIGETIYKYRNQVLTILCIPRECNRVKSQLFEEVGNMALVEIKEDFATGEAAKGYLKVLAKENSIRTDKKLFASLTDETGYLAKDLRKIFDEWYDLKLRNTIYPEYKEAIKAKAEFQKALPKGSAYEKLCNLVGLGSAKAVIDQIIDYYKFQKMYKEKGVTQETLSRHLCFTGNSGVGKTEVARQLAGALKSNGVLSKGHLVEVHANDLVAAYVGQTAIKTKKVVESSIGGILFLDEAYSLAIEHSGGYSEEALTTLVAEMENHRDELIVIFAGYKNDIEKLLKMNQGLRSRISFIVDFPDYNVQELCDIASLMAKNKGLEIEPAAMDKLRGIFEGSVAGVPEAGNARAVRNILEHARMNQASRLVKMPFDDVTQKDIITIKAEDISAPEIEVQTRKSIGFCA